jgi:hypothetical protein
MINQTFTAIPGGIEYDAVYPAAQDQTAYLGADDVTRYINDGVQDCPQQQYAILGYSQGASATMLTLNNITDRSSDAYKAIKAVLVVGNPYHVPEGSVNVDQNGSDGTKKYPGVLYNAKIASSRGIPKTYYDNGKLVDICHTEDAICAPEAPNSSLVPGHLQYGDENVQDLGAKFLISKLSSDASSPSSTSTSTATAAATATSSSSTSSESPQGSGGAHMASMSCFAALGGILAMFL